MHRSAAWGFAALALAAAPAFAADPPADKPAEKPWYARLVGGDAKPAGPPTFADTPARPAMPVGPLDPTVLADALRDEQAAWDRRMEVCHRLRTLAAETNDDALGQQAEELERRATELYHARTARLGVKAPRSTERRPTRPMPALEPLPEPTTPTGAAAPTPFKEVARD